MERSPALAEVGRDSGELVGLVDVELGRVGRRVAEPLGEIRCVIREPAAEAVRTISAPSSCARRATKYAIEPSVGLP